MVKVIASDMDGTFLNDQSEFDTEAFQVQLDQMKDKGMHFICATSNTYAHSLRQFSQNSGPIAYVCDNGAHVIDDRGVTVFEDAIDPLLLRQIIEFLQTDRDFVGAEIILAGRNGSYCNLPAESDRFKDSQNFYEDLQSVGDLTMIFDAIYKVDLMVDGANAVQMARTVRQQFANKVNAVSSGMNGVDIMNFDINKANGVQELLRKWQLTFADVAAFGDNGNDFEMVNDAAEGFAMKNAAPDLLAMVSNVTEYTNAESGVQKKIAEYLN